MGFLDVIFKRNSELGFMFDSELFQEKSNRVYMKKLAIDTCVAFLGRTISQSEFRIRSDGELVKNELYYRLNVRPNKNMTASTFWQTVVQKLIYDNECLIIQADDDDLLIADNFKHNQFAVYEDTFTEVEVKDFKFRRSYLQSEVIHLRYTNESLAPLIDGLFADYGDLFGRILSAQKRKHQIRGTVDIDTATSKDRAKMSKLQSYINSMYKSFGEKDIAIVPQQPGFAFTETSSGGSGAGQSVDEINKVTNGFLDQVATVIGIPASLLHGDMADVEKQTKNFMLFTVNPFLKKITDEGNYKFLTKDQYLNGDKIEAKAISYNSLFDIADKIDKIISSGAFSANEVREEAGREKSDDPNLDKHYITKNYTEIGSLEGGENE